METLSQLKDFVADRPEYAFLVFSIVTNTILFRLYVKEKDAHLSTVIEWLPIVERLTTLLAAAATKVRGRKSDTTPE